MMNINDIITKIENEVPGWTPGDQLRCLFLGAINQCTTNKNILEIGSWCGRSTIVLAIAAKILGSKVYSIDLFPNLSDWYQNADKTWSYSTLLNNGAKINGCVEQTVWDLPFQNEILPVYKKNPALYEIFKGNLKKFSVEKFVCSFKGTIDTEISKIPNIGFIFIDADHGYRSVVNEIEKSTKKLVDGGWVYFDDAFTCNPGVDRAITEKIINSNKFSNYFQLTRKCFIAQKMIQK